jgi:transaldolase / glucose-6-phosphate isomerase
MARAPRHAGGPTPADGTPVASGFPGWSLGPTEAAVVARLEAWAASDAVGRFWRKEAGFWPQAPASDVASRLGWLRAAEQSAARVGEFQEFARKVRDDGFEHVVLLGMGGSSLAAETIAESLPHGKGYPSLSILDSTHPRAVAACASSIPLARTLFLVSSKSGTTLEPNVFFRFFWQKVRALDGPPGRRFVAITDPGTALEKLAAERGFRACVASPPDVGGRYSALTVFGLVPAALIGADLPGLLASARAMVARCADPAEAPRNPGLRLGAALGELGRAGRDKVVFLPSRSLSAFPAWAEQLIAESLGKHGRGLVPVAAPMPPSELPHGSDAVLVRLARPGEQDRALERALLSREAAGEPVLHFEVALPLDLGAEFFRWEFAIAACGAVLGVDPFDQPDVEHAKDLARAEMREGAAEARSSAGYGLTVGRPGAAELERWLASVRPGDYVAVQAFLAPEEGTRAAIDRLASRLRRRLGVVVTTGFGPRFQHSTGQLHKGGPPTGAFLQLVDEPTDDLAVPESELTFGEIVRGQARGDHGALEEVHRRVVVVNVGARTDAGLRQLARAVGPAEGATPAPA